MLVHDFLDYSARHYPDKEAVVCDGERITYSRLKARADHLAQWLLSRGLEPQDRVVVFLDNSIASVISIFGVLKAGGVFILLNPGMKAGKIGYILGDSTAGFCITQKGRQKEFLSAAAAPGSVLRHILVVSGEREDEKAGVNRGFQVWSWQEVMEEDIQGQGKVATSIDIDLAALIYTSGSTGEPKGVMCAHCNMVAAARSITCYLAANSRDIVLCALPLSFDYGVYQVLMSVMVGGTVVLERSFLYPFRVLECLAREKATGFPVVPTMAAMLLRLEDLEQFDLSSLRYITNTAAALPGNHIRRLRELFPGVDIFSMYGLTECKRVSYLPPADIDRKPESVGLPIPNEDVFIVDDQGCRVGPGQAGELLVRGANVMQGYWQAPGETAKVFRPGRYRGETLLYTGDLFRQDEEGYLYFLGRMDDQIKTRGERVNPKEVENVLSEMEGVHEAAVVGVPDEISGLVLKAFIIAAPGHNLEEKYVRRYCVKNLEPFMVPAYLVFCEDLPRTANGKVDRKVLQGQGL